MNCDFCHKNEANIHLIKIQGGNVERINICKECAAEFSFLNEEDFYGDFAKILYRLFQVGDNGFHIGRDKKILRSINYSRNRKCSFCGIDLKTIKKIGKVGCSNCYNEFKDVLYPVVKSIQGCIESRGKIPVNTSSRIKLEKNIRDLRSRLKSEIIIENFEEAARIRDEIRKLEKSIYEQ